ncbi:ribokinase [Escherichia coli]|nr:ribokinase [Escherichia coli]
MKFERHHEILKRLSKFGSVKVSDLSNSLNVTGDAANLLI